MAKHNIQATSTVCGVAQHTWLPTLTANYRECGQCHTVEMLVGGQWVSPTARVKRSSRVVLAPSYSWTQEMRLKNDDFQVKETRLLEMPSVQAVQSAAESRVSEAGLSINASLGAHWHRERVYWFASQFEWKALTLKFKVDKSTRYESSYVIADGELEWRRFVESAGYTMIIRGLGALERLYSQRVDGPQETVKLLNVPTVSPSVEKVMTRPELGEELFAWGTEHGYPELQVDIPACVYTVADVSQSEIRLSERVHTIVSGLAAWRSVCFQSPQSIIEAALEQTKDCKSPSSVKL